MQNYQIVTRYQLDVFQQVFRKKVSRFFFIKWRFSDAMFRRFGTKNRKYSKATRMDILKWNTNKTQKDVKLSYLQNGYFGFLILYKYPQSSKLVLFKK